MVGQTLKRHAAEQQYDAKTDESNNSKINDSSRQFISKSSADESNFSFHCMWNKFLSDLFFLVG